MLIHFFTERRIKIGSYLTNLYNRGESVPPSILSKYMPEGSLLTFKEVFCELIF